MRGLFDNDEVPASHVPALRGGKEPTAQQQYREQLLARLPVSPEYRPDLPPELRGETKIILNAETTGLRWYDRDKPVGWSYWLPESGRHGYLPMRHKPGGNLGVEQVRDWLRSLKHIKVDNTNTKFDAHMAREDGADLVEQGCTFGDVAHRAALLDDHRMRFNLDMLSKDVLGWDVETDGLGKKPSEINGEVEFQYLHPERVAPYAVRNVEQVHRLSEAFAPMICEEDLQEVLDLEEQIIPVVIEMEKNGTYLDMDLLHEWQRRATRELEDKLDFVRRETMLDIESPDSAKDLEKIFKVRGLPITSRTAHGAPSFTDAVLKLIPDPCIQAMRGAGQLADLKSKYLDKYANAARSDGWLRFNLHQLRSVGDGEDKKGTVSGRFSAAGDREGGYNPQQVVAVEKQLERGWCPDYVIRKLFRPQSGVWLAADMMQVEYRLFAHYANLGQAFHMEPLQKMINGKPVWIQGPLADFHAVVSELLLPVNPRLNRKLVKNINFAKIYGAGLVKFAFMLGLITEEQYKMLVARQLAGDRSVKNDALLVEASGINNAYMEMFPAVGKLLYQASQTAKNRGYVRTIMGRRARLDGRFHSALNRIVQGGAADINKRVLIEFYKARKALGLTLRLTVHDEVCADLADEKMLSAVDSVLNKQYFNLRAPILWDIKTGANWAACK